MGLVSLLATFTARKYLIAFAFTIGALVALAAGLVIPKQYRSTAIVQVDSLQENLLTGLFEPRVRLNEFLGQHAAIAKSRTVSLEVFDKLNAEGFFVAADFENEWRRKTKAELIPGNDPRLWAGDQLLEKLDVRADTNGSTLSISFQSEDPAQSARIANAFANAYMDAVLDKRQRRFARNAANFSDETRILETELDQAQEALSTFRESSGIVGIGDERLEGEEVALASITTRLAEAKADLSEARSLQRQAREARSTELLTLPLPHGMLSGLEAQSRLGPILIEMQRLNERYGSKNPDYIEASNAKAVLEATIRQAVEDRAEFAERRVFALQESAERQKAEVVSLQETKQEYDVLQKKVEASRQTYDLVATRSLQESLQSRVDFVDVLLLARAVPPDNAVTPPLAIIVLIGMVAGGALGVSGAVALEILEGRVRTKNALGQALRAPVIAELNSPPKISRAVKTPKLRRAA